MRGADLVIHVGRGVVRAELMRGGKPAWAAESSYASPADLTGALAALGSERPVARGARSARIELDRPLVQIRRLSGLPPVRGSALRALVAHQAGRFFRKNGVPVVTDASWEPRVRGTPPIAVAAAVEEPWLEAIVEGVRMAGLEPRMISVAGLGGMALLPPGERAAHARAERRRLQILAAVVAAIWIGIGALALGRVVGQAAAVDREFAALSPAAAAARAVRQEYDAAAAMVSILEGETRVRGIVVRRAAEIALALPDSAYLMTLQVTEDGGGELTGASRRAPDVVAALERTDAVAAPRLVGPTVHSLTGGRDYERFTLRFGSDSAR